MVDQTDPAVRSDTPTPAAWSLLVVGSHLLYLEISKMLCELGYRIHAVPETSDLPAALEKSTPDLILLEYSPALLQQDFLQSLAGRLPVILLCAADDKDCRGEGFTSGCADVLSLPLRAEELHARIASQLKLVHLEKALRKQVKAFDLLKEARNESERQFRLMADNVDEIFFIASENSQEFYYINPAFEVITGVPVEKLYQNPKVWRELVSPTGNRQTDQEEDEVWGKLKMDLQRRELEITRPDGATRWVWLQRKPVYNEQGELVFQVGTATDITDRVNAEKAMREAQSVAEARAAELQVAIQREQWLNEITRAISSRLDLQGILTNVVNLCVDLLGANAGSLGILSEDANQLEVLYHINLPENLRRMTTFARANGGVIWEVIDTLQPVLIDDYQQVANPVPALAEAGTHAMLGVPIRMGEACLGTLAIYHFNPAKKFTPRDLSLAESIGRQAGVAITNARLFEEVQRLAITDPLTQISNRRHFFEQAQKEVMRLQRYGGSLSVIMLDIDYFKEINDQYTHLAGDQVLRQLADFCRKSLRSLDHVARYGGEEFIFLLPETGIEEAAHTARRLCTQISEKKFEVSRRRSISITTSMGVTSLTSLGMPIPGEDVDVVIDRLVSESDRALYLSKASGRNQVTIWREKAWDQPQ